MTLMDRKRINPFDW